MMVPRQSPFLAWPGWPHLRIALGLGSAFTLWFCAIYGGCSWLTAQRALRVRIHLDAELGLPLVPPFLLAYMSIYLLILAEPFVLRTRRAFRALVAAQAFATLVGGTCFVLLPSQTAWPVPGNLGNWQALYDFADWLNLDYNNLPSLHVALGVLCVVTFAPYATRPVRLLLWCWAVALSASTVLTHQHHLIDVPAGWVLALLARRYVYTPLARDAPGNELEVCPAVS